MVKPQTSNLEASFGFRCLEIGQNQGTQGTIQIVIVNPAPSVFITPIIKNKQFCILGSVSFGVLSRVYFDVFCIQGLGLARETFNQVVDVTMWYPPVIS
jgi:hypothetical protein